MDTPAAEQPTSIVQTRVTYMYRCASNHKYWGEFVVDGTLNFELLEPILFDHEFFVATEVGLKHLLTDSWNEDDHVLHSLCEFEKCEGQVPICSASQMNDRFRTAAFEGWISTYARI
jgi:hypothetical protein